MLESSPVSSSSSSRYQYRCSPSHHKTLNVLGKVKNFSKLSMDELGGYCSLAKYENECQSAADVSEVLAHRFGWPTATRLLDIEIVWKSLHPSITENEHENGLENVIMVDIDMEEDKSIKIITEKLTEPSVSASSIPIIIKNNTWDRKILVCEVDDQEFNILGDSGAVGRISVDSSSLSIDVKGRQYKGSIYSGPTVILLNLAAPVGLPACGGSYQQTARVEVLTNEYCQLTFERDLLGSMMGLYSGSMASYDDNNGEEDDSGSPKKNKKRGNDEDSDDNAETNDVGTKLKAPKISTITNRTRTVKKGSKKKSSKSIKSKK